MVNAIYDDSLRPLELTIAQLNLLVAIVNLDEDATAKRIGDVLAIEKSTLSRDLGRMEAGGLVRRRVAGRAKPLELTTRGQKKLEAALPAWERAQARAAEVVPALAAIAGAARAVDVR
jgi:DNA-binding MarR family transcriptional regulator